MFKNKDCKLYLSTYHIDHFTIVDGRKLMFVICTKNSIMMQELSYQETKLNWLPKMVNDKVNMNHDCNLCEFHKDLKLDIPFQMYTPYNPQVNYLPICQKEYFTNY